MSQLSMFNEWTQNEEPFKISKGIRTKVEIKTELEEIQKVINQIKEAYLDSNNNRSWVFTFSGGKDSTLQCICVWKALLEIPEEQRTRPVYIISSDTGLEVPGLKEFVSESIEKMNISAKEQGLQCLSARIVGPDQKNRFAAKVIAHGLPMPQAKSRYRWCTDAFKISPAEIFIKTLMKEYGEVVVFTGVRNDESTKRSLSIKKNGGEGFIFPKKQNKSKDGVTVSTVVKGRYECHPIKDITDSVLWDTLKSNIVFPWKVRFLNLIKFYKNADECPMQIGEMQKSCGSATSRTGCVICHYVNEDQMLNYYLTKGEDWAKPMLQLRTLMIGMLYDANFREPLRKTRIKKLDAFYDSMQSENGQLTLESLEHRHNQDVKIREFSSLCLGGKPVNPEIALASFTLEARIFLLKNILYYQKKAGLELVTSKDLEYIKMVWNQEFGWIENDRDLTPEALNYFGALVLTKDYSINEKETSIQNLVIDPKYYAEEERLSHLGTHKCKEDLSKLHGLKILNHQKSTPPEEMNFVFYVNLEFGGGEEEIFDTLNTAKSVTGINIPYYWSPVIIPEKESDIFWNNVTFIVCKENIKTSRDAREFVTSFVEKGCRKVKLLEHSIDKKYLKMIENKSQLDARRIIYQLGLHPNCLSESIKTHVGVGDDELMVAHAIKSSIGKNYTPMDAEKASKICKSNGKWEKVFWSLLSDLKTPGEVKSFLIEQGFAPEVVPNDIKYYAEISEMELFFGRKVALYGMGECLNALLCFPERHSMIPDFMKEPLNALIKSLSRKMLTIK